MTPRNIRKLALITLLAATAFRAAAQPAATSAPPAPAAASGAATAPISPAVPAAQPAAAGNAPAKPALLPAGDPNERVSLDWPALPLSLAIPEIEKLTGRTIIRSAALANVQDLTLKFANPPTRAEALQAIETLLTINQLALVPLGDKFLKLVPLNTVRLEAPTFIEGSVLDLPPSGRIATKLFQLQFLRATEFVQQLPSMLNDQIRTFSFFVRSNSILITDSITTLQRIEMILKQVDRPGAMPVQAKFYTLEFAKASDMVTKLRTIFQSTPALQQQLGEATSFNADDRTNQVFVIADPRQFSLFDDLIKKLDTKADPNTRNEVIRLRTALAQDVATILQNVISGQTRAAQAAAAQGANPNQRQTGGAGGAAGAFAGGQGGAGRGANQGAGGGGRGVNQGAGGGGGRGGAGGNYQGGGGGYGGRGGGAGGAGTLQQVAGGGGNRGGATGMAVGGVGAAGAAGGISAASLGLDIGDQFSNYITVYPDQRTNSIVVSGTVDDIRIIKDLIEKLDILLSQVRIEVVIAEVSLTDASSSGIDTLGLQVVGNKLVGFSAGAAGAGFGIGGAAGSNGGTTGLATVDRIASGFSLSGFIGLATTPRKNNIVSVTKQDIVTMHNQKGTFFFGETRPVITASTMNDTSGNTTSSVTQLEIGTTVTITPLIGYDGSVQLTLDLEVSDVTGNVTLDGNTQYIIGKRNNTSTIIAKSGDIIVLGGTQKDASLKTTNRLGPIPIIGDLLGARSRSHTRNELIFFLRPVVLTNGPEDNAPAYKQLEDMTNREEVKKLLGKDVDHPLETNVAPANKKG